ncbi:MAG TPA: HPr kinase/phosphatase C-terminal domain-containing protein [Stellaceae bacterium]|nr:HPr kinase/phosphatase C-terminal domain-containing protein [Stellaceae bacterium]
MSGETILVHATAVAIGGRSMLLRGPSGSGKSDLALRLIDAGALLVSDDYSQLRREGDAIMVRAPKPISGLIEARGVGILKVEALAAAPLALIVDLVAPQHVERLPEPRSETIFGLAIPLVTVAPFEASATAKLRFALAASYGDGTAAPLAR